MVGESGCGKTTLGRTILQLEKATAGQILIQRKGRLLNLSKTSTEKTSEKTVQIIFQDPFSSLNPRITVGACYFRTHARFTGF